MSKFFRKKEGKETKDVIIGIDTVNEINDEFAKLQKQYRKLKHTQQMVMSKDVTTNLKMKLKGAQERLRRKILENEALEQQYVEACKELEKLKKENEEDVEKKMSEKDRETILSLKERIEKHKETIQRLEENDESIKLQEKLNSTQITLKKFSSENNKLRIQLNSKREQLNQLEGEIQKQTELMSGSEKDLEELKNRLYKKNQQEIQKLKQTLNKQEFELRKLRKLEESKSNVSLQQRLVSLKMQLEKKLEENKTLERQLSQLKLVSSYTEESETTLISDQNNLSDFNTISETESERSIKDDQIPIKSSNSTDELNRFYNFANDEKSRASIGSEFSENLKDISQEEGEETFDEEINIQNKITNDEDSQNKKNTKIKKKPISIIVAKNCENNETRVEISPSSLQKTISDDNISDHQSNTEFTTENTDNTENTENTELTEHTEHTENTENTENTSKMIQNESEDENSDIISSKKDSINEKQQQTTTVTTTTTTTTTTTEDISENQNNEQEENIENNYDVKSIDLLFTIPTAIEYFKEFLCEQLNQENILFFLEVKEFKNSYQNQKKTNKIAKRIYDKYIKPGSLFEVNIDYSNRQELTELMQDKKISLDMFDQAQEIVFRHMEHNSFSQFKKSKLYKELIHKLKTDTGFNFSSTHKKAIMVSRKKVVTALNVDFKFQGNAKNCYLLSTELMEILIDIFTSHYSISSKQIDFNHISQSIPFHRFVATTTELQKTRLKFLREEQALPFFLNIYNILLLHAAIVNGIPPDKTSLRNFFRESKYSIDGLKYSLQDIKNGILRANKDKRNNNYFKQDDPRSKYCVKKLIPKIHFSLISLNSSRSVIQTYYKDKVNQQMKNSTRLQLPKMISFKKNRLILPKVFQIYSKDFGGNTNKTLKWISRFLSEDKKKKLEQYDLSNIKYEEETIGIPVFLIDTMSPIKKKWGKKKKSTNNDNNTNNNEIEKGNGQQQQENNNDDDEEEKNKEEKVEENNNNEGNNNIENKKMSEQQQQENNNDEDDQEKNKEENEEQNKNNDNKLIEEEYIFIEQQQENNNDDDDEEKNIEENEKQNKNDDDKSEEEK
ncbi:electron carrier/ protein disulfide oxidoreductase [Anaeramoeba flamelloides]|uniref:Electron carrier/ protein disulfide oxidoreductase n=1 Tax=Anaeramoeba flamelloides TaxID=1746091 RepID=A0ABQ8Y8U6_9EUKA|nr:electron carrier/ protein disulfide oxidoreductase [Anaeramoeba flamelloides]